MATATACGGGPALEQVDADPRLERASLVLLTLDTTRADHVSCYGGPEGLTPTLDAVAAGGTLFREARSQANVTNPSHTAIFTGLRGLDSGILNNYTPLEPGVDTLAAAFQRAGYRTAAFPASSHVSAGVLGLPGFDHSSEIDGDADEVVAADNVDRAVAWLEQNGDRPFFIWVHFFDPHTPYTAPPEYQERFYPGDPEAGDAPRLRDNPVFLLSHQIVRDQFDAVRDPEYPIAMYRAEVSYMDTEIGRLLGELDRMGLAETTGIVAVADHGESLGEHDVYFGHRGMQEENLRIPMIARLPGFPSGVDVDRPVDHLDLAPTLAKLYGVKLQTEGKPWIGRDLSALLDGGTMAADPAPRSRVHEHSANQQVAVRRGSWKLVRKLPKVTTLEARSELYDLSADPREARNVAAENPDVVGELEEPAAPWFERGRLEGRDRGQIAFRDEEHRKRYEAEKERLRRLGYLEYVVEGEDVSMRVAAVAEELRKVYHEASAAADLSEVDRTNLRARMRAVTRELRSIGDDTQRLREVFLDTVKMLRETFADSLSEELEAKLRELGEAVAEL